LGIEICNRVGGYVDVICKKEKIMHPKSLVLLIIFFLLFSNCSSDSEHEIIEKSCLNSYKLLDSKCLFALKKVMEPSGMEQAGFEFKRAYLLDVKLDTLFNKSDEFVNYIFVGFEIDSSKNLQIFAIDLNSGEIKQCKALKGRNSIIINKSRTMFSNTNYLKGTIFDNDSVIFCNKHSETIGLWELSSNDHIHGKWFIDSNESSFFNNSNYMEIWYAIDNKIFFLSKENENVIDSSIFRTFSDSLIIHAFEDTFKLQTYSDNALVISKFNSDSNYILIRK